MPVKTQKEIKEGAEKSAPVEKQIKEKKEIKTTGKRIFQLPCAPKGKCECAIDGEFGQVELTNGKIEIKESDRKEQFITALKKVGFVDVSKINAKSVKISKSGKFTYYVMHPEQTDGNNINGNVSVPLSGFDSKGMARFEQCTIERGIIVTEKKEIYDALIKYGFLNYSVKEEEADD